jgi:hypothetical protein
VRRHERERGTTGGRLGGVPAAAGTGLVPTDNAAASTAANAAAAADSAGCANGAAAGTSHSNRCTNHERNVHMSKAQPDIVHMDAQLVASTAAELRATADAMFHRAWKLSEHVKEELSEIRTEIIRLQRLADRLDGGEQK